MFLKLTQHSPIMRIKSLSDFYVNIPDGNVIISRVFILVCFTPPPGMIPMSLSLLYRKCFLLKNCKKNCIKYEYIKTNDFINMKQYFLNILISKNQKQQRSQFQITILFIIIDDLIFENPCNLKIFWGEHLHHHHHHHQFNIHFLPR